MPDREKGKLRILLGYAAGVGKTYRMLEEAQQAKRAGRDVVVGYFEPHGRKDTIAKTEGLEIVPRYKIDYRGREFEEMDTDAILGRRPQPIDDCAHSQDEQRDVPADEVLAPELQNRIAERNGGES